MIENNDIEESLNSENPENMEHEKNTNVDNFLLTLTTPILSNKKSVLKASATIAISGELTLAERRVYNVLYAHAYDRMSEELIHSITLPELLKSMERTVDSYEEIKSILEKLVGTSVQYNILGKDKRDIWGVAALLASAEINKETGVVTYEFPQRIRPFLNAPPYGKIPLKTQTKLNSSHSLTLYELCCDYFDARRGYGETGWLSLEQFQELLGTNYKEWRDIQKHLIQTPLSKINSMQKEFDATYQIRKPGKRVIAVKFAMQAREQTKEVIAPTENLFTKKTFSSIKIGQTYRIVGGTDDIFVKIDNQSAQNIRTRKPILMQNLDVAVEVFR